MISPLVNSDASTLALYIRIHVYSRVRIERWAQLGQPLFVSFVH